MLRTDSADDTAQRNGSTSGSDQVQRLSSPAESDPVTSIGPIGPHTSELPERNSSPAVSNGGAEVVQSLLRAAHVLRGLLASYFAEFGLSEVRYTVLKIVRDSTVEDVFPLLEVVPVRFRVGTHLHAPVIGCDNFRMDLGASEHVRIRLTNSLRYSLGFLLAHPSISSLVRISHSGVIIMVIVKRVRQMVPHAAPPRFHAPWCSAFPVVYRFDLARN